MAESREAFARSTAFRLREEEVFVSIQRTADLLSERLERLLKPAGLSPTQYNVLRILRGAGDAGCSCGEIGERMVTRDPDVTRLLDRLERRGLVARSRERKDRRVITIRITAEGLALLASLDEMLEQFHRRELSHLGDPGLCSLLQLLARIREQGRVSAGSA